MPAMLRSAMRLVLTIRKIKVEPDDHRRPIPFGIPGWLRPVVVRIATG